MCGLETPSCRMKNDKKTSTHTHPWTSLQEGFQCVDCPLGYTSPMKSPNETYCFPKASLLPGETTGGGGGVGTKSCVGGQVGAQRGWRSLCRNSWTVAGRRLQWGRWEEEIPFGALSPSSIGIARSIYPDATLGMEGLGSHMEGSGAPGV